MHQKDETPAVVGRGSKALLGGVSTPKNLQGEGENSLGLGPLQELSALELARHYEQASRRIAQEGRALPGSIGRQSLALAAFYGSRARLLLKGGA